MGVNGILPRVLPAAGHQVDLTQFKQGVKPPTGGPRRPIRIALDVSAWIAKACHGYGSMLMDDRHLSNYGRAKLFHQQQSEEIENVVSNNATAEQEFVTHCASFVLKKIVNLRDNCKAQILVVLDGASPPIKSKVCRERRNRRQEAAQQRDQPVAHQDDERGEKRLKAARRAGAENPKLHATIVAELIKALRINQITFLVAPYEADGQLAYLSQCGYTDLIVTDDSDLIGHGANAIVYKLDEGNCRGVLLQRHDLGATRPQCSLLDFSNAMLATMFVAAGCDYCESLRGIGIVKARNIVKDAFHGQECNDKKRSRRRCRDEPVLSIVFRQLYQDAYDKQMSVQEKEEYEERFIAALLVYRHPVVFDPVQGKCLLAGDPPHGSDPELLEYEPYARLCKNAKRMQRVVGQLRNPVIASLIAEGWMNPRTNRLYENTEIPDNVKETFEQLKPSAEHGGSDKDARETVEDDSPEMETQDDTADMVCGIDVETQEQIMETTNGGALETQDETVEATQQDGQMRQGADAEESTRDDTEVTTEVDTEGTSGFEKGPLSPAAKVTTSAPETPQDEVAAQNSVGEAYQKNDVRETASEHDSINTSNPEERALENDSMERTHDRGSEARAEPMHHVAAEELPGEMAVEAIADEDVVKDADVEASENQKKCEDSNMQDLSPDSENEEVGVQEQMAVEATEEGMAGESDSFTQDTVDYNMDDATHGSAVAVDAESPQLGTQYSAAIEIQDDSDDGLLETQEVFVPHHVGSVSHSIDLTQNSSGTSSTSRFASQPSSHPSDGSHISADVRSPNLLPTFP